MRNQFVLTVFAAIWLMLLIRVYQLSIKSNTYYEALAKQNIVRVDRVAPVRGEILDSQGNPLAINEIGFKLTLSPHLEREYGPKQLQKTLDLIHGYLPETNTTKLMRRYRKQDSPYRHESVVIIPFIDYEKVLPFYTLLSRHPLISLEAANRRHYPYGKSCAHVVGYVGKANQRDIEEDPVVELTKTVGKSGLERYYNRFLEGEPGFRRVKVSAFNKVIETLEIKPPEEMHNIRLHLDIELQRYIEKLFEKFAGAVIVMRTDGAIVAAGSYPAFNPNDFVGGISRSAWKEIIEDLNHPFTNKLIHGLYPPGSVIKMGVGMSFIESKKLSPYTSSFCRGSIKLGNHRFRCWKKVGHGKTDLLKAIRESCDVYFYNGSLKTGIAAISRGLSKMGFGEKTGVDLPNEFIGVVPNEQWKAGKYGQPWYLGETLNAAIGQGYMLVTPMQIARYTALLATGRLPEPRLISQLGDRSLPMVSEDVFSRREKRTLPLIRRAMEQVCNHPKGTAYWGMRRCKIKVAGKTGTAQVIGIPQEEKKRMKEEDLAYFHRSHAWLTTYGPIRYPQYIVTILVEHGGHGGSAAGPLASKIYNWLKKEKKIW